MCKQQFGAGPRACIGKHISLMEMWKVVADTVRTFDFQLEDPGEAWKLYGSWFVKQGPIPMMFRRRRGGPLGLEKGMEEGGGVRGDDVRMS